MIDGCAGASLVSSCCLCLDGGEWGTGRRCSGCRSFWADRLFLHQADSDWITQNRGSELCSLFEELNIKVWELTDQLWLSGLDSAWLDKISHNSVALALFWGCFPGFCFLPRCGLTEWRSWAVTFQPSVLWKRGLVGLSTSVLDLLVFQNFWSPQPISAKPDRPLSSLRWQKNRLPLGKAEQRGLIALVSVQVLQVTRLPRSSSPSKHSYRARTHRSWPTRQRYQQSSCWVIAVSKSALWKSVAYRTKQSSHNSPVPCFLRSFSPASRGPTETPTCLFIKPLLKQSEYNLY